MSGLSLLCVTSLAGMGLVLSAALARYQPPEGFALSPPIYELVSVTPTSFPELTPGSPVRDFHVSPIVVKAKNGVPPPDRVEFAWREFGVSYTTWVPISGSSSVPAPGGFTLWTLVTPHSLSPFAPAGPVNGAVSALSNVGRSNTLQVVFP